MFCRERWLLSALLLLGFIAGGRSELQYVLTSSASLFSGETGKACLILMGNKENVDVSLVLQHDGKNITIIAEDVSASKYFQCADYKVPNVAKAVPVSLLLYVKGKATEILERKTAVIKPNKNNCIFQMDKPLYQTSQKVHFRIICLNPQLKPVNEKFPNIYILDPTNARIKQWRKQETQDGVASYDFQVIKDAPLGIYRIVAERESSYSLSQWFNVEEFVMPRFKVTVDTPDSISVLDDALMVKVSAKYPYGKSVAGKVTMIYCKQPSLYGRRQNCFKTKEDLCSNMSGKLNSDGVYEGSIDMTGQFMGLTGMSIRLDTIVTEEGTGIQMSNSRYVWVTTQPSRLNLDYEVMKQYYRRGIPYLVKAVLTDEKDKPIPNEDIEIKVDQNLVATVKTDADGKIEHEIDTFNMVAPNFTVQVNYMNPDQCYYAEWRDTDYPTAEYTAYRFYSRTDSFIQGKPIKGQLQCGETRNVELQYSIGKAGLQDGEKEMTFVFLYQAKGRILQSSEANVDLTNSLNGTVSIPVTATADMAPNTNILAMGILKGELIADIIPVEVENCFKNEVSMTFSAEKVLPGSTAEVILSGDPDSICGLKMIDSSLLLMNRYEQFTPQRILNMFSYWSYGYNIEGFNVEDPEPPCLDPNKLVFFEGNYYLPTSSDTEGDSYGYFKQVGMLFATKLQTRKPKICVDKAQRQFKGVIHGEAAPEAAVALKSAADRGFGAGAGGGDVVDTFRKNFSDSFMWLMVPLDKDGHASLSEQIPDSITEWQGSAFCLSNKGGFGMTKNAATLTAFQPFFLDSSNPNSFYRGETLVSTATVRNYMDYCIKAEVTLEPSKDFTAKLMEGTQNACLCSGDQASYIWHIQSEVIGEIPLTISGRTTFIGKSCDGPNDDSQPSRRDTVLKTILSEPEGIRIERTLSNLIFVKPDMKLTLPVSITPPNNVVPDSISSHISTVGDVIALPLKNLEDLVQNAYGSGEQNLARIAPVVYVLDYLNATGQLKDDILEKGKQKILEGYYRQLGYAYGEAYKVFRSSDQPNSWLTLYSFKVLEQAKRYVEIDETRQQQTLIWLENQQKLSNGCFEPQGSLFTFRLQDADRSLYYTSNIAIALLETQYSLGKTMLEGAMECLKNASKSEQDIVNEVHMLYAFTLAGLAEYRDPLMLKLMKKAKVKDGTMHWEREDMPKIQPVLFFNPIFPSPEVQLTSLMLLSILGGNHNANPPARANTKTKPSVLSTAAQQTLTIAAQISLWISQQLNSNGGLSSTMNTVVGLQGLTALAKTLYTPNSQQTITVKNRNRDIGTINLNPENRMEVQRFDLPEASGDYSMEVQGNGWSLFQVTTKYNIPIPKEDSAFDLSLSTSSDGCVNGVAKAFNISVSLSYKGPEKVSEMTVLQIRMMSGYKSDYWSLKTLENNKVISKFEENLKGELTILVENVTKDLYFFQFTVIMDDMVLNMKESSGMVFNSYNEAENGYASYKHPCE